MGNESGINEKTKTGTSYRETLEASLESVGLKDGAWTKRAELKAEVMMVSTDMAWLLLDAPLEGGPIEEDVRRKVVSLAAGIFEVVMAIYGVLRRSGDTDGD